MAIAPQRSGLARQWQLRDTLGKFLVIEVAGKEVRL
jgi:hypothetical protein